MEKHKNIPQLRFPEFLGEWERKKLGEVATNKVTNSFSRENLNYEIGAVKNIHYGDIHTKFQILFDVTKENVPFINGEISIQRINEENYCIEGDLIFADASEDLNDVGKSIEIVNLNDEKLLSGLHTILVRPNLNTFQKGFAGYLFKSNNIRLQIQKESQGSKILSISGGRLLNTIISFPTLPEQTRIANFLTAVDEKIQSLKKKKGLLEAYKKGVMQRLFSVSGKDARPCVFTDEDGQAFPAWEVKKLGEVCEIKKGEQLNKEELTETGEYICINGGIFPSGFTDKFNVNENTITISEGGNSCGYVNFFKTKFWSGGHNYSLNIINVKQTNKDFLYQILKQNESEIMKLRVGSGLPNIQKKDLLEFKITFSNSLPEQTRIANFLSAIDDKIKHNNTQIEKMQVWKKGLLQRMFV